MIVDGGKFPWRQYPKKFYMLNVPEVAYHGVVYVDHYGDAAFVARCRTVCQRNTGATLSPLTASCSYRDSDSLPTGRAARRKRAEGRRILRAHPLVDWVNYVGFPTTALSMAHRYLGTNFCSFADIWRERRLRGRQEVLQRFPPLQANGKHG